MFTVDAVLRSGFQHLEQMDWDPQLSGFDGWGSEVFCPTRWCAGLTSRVPASAQSVFGATFVLGSDRPVTMNLVFPEHYPRFSSNPVRSLSSEHLELLLEGVGVDEGENSNRCLEWWEEDDEGDRESPEEFPDVVELLPKYYRENFSSMYRTG